MTSDNLAIIGCPSAGGSLGISSVVPSRTNISSFFIVSSRTSLSIQDVPYVSVLRHRKWDVPIGIGRYPFSSLSPFRVGHTYWDRTLPIFFAFAVSSGTYLLG